MNEITRICPWLNGFAHSKKPIFTPEECKIIINHGLNFWEEKTGMIEKSGHRQGYKADLISRPWIWGVTDCWSLVREYYSTIEINYLKT